MTNEDSFTAAIESIAESMALIAVALTAANATQDAESQGEAPKRGRGRPRKEAAAPATEPAKGEMAQGLSAEEKVALAAPLLAEPTDDERAAKTKALKTAVLQCITLHGEAIARQRLIYPMVSVVPYEEADAIIKALET